MMQSKPLSIGDPIEVQFLTPTGEVWRPATVCGVKGRELGVAFADHSRLVLEVHGNIKFRRPQTTPTGGNC